MAKKKKYGITDAMEDAGTLLFGGVGTLVAKKIAEATQNHLSNDSDDDADDTENNEPSLIKKAFEAYNNDDYEEALEYAKQGKDEFKPFYYYKLCGDCHYFIWSKYDDELDEKKELLEGVDENDSRWKKLQPLRDKVESERSKAEDNYRECIRLIQDEDEVDPDEIARIFIGLSFVAEDLTDKRRFTIIGAAHKDLKASGVEEYNRLTDGLLKFYNFWYDVYIDLKKTGDWSRHSDKPSDPIARQEDWEDLLKNHLFSGQEYSSRQFIYIAKDVNSLIGCYSDTIERLFTIDKLPKELKFPIGHPQPNSLYYAHPAKKGFYLPVDSADKELFDDKVRDFIRLAQCLGATRIEFKSLKGRKVSEGTTTSLGIEVGGEYKKVGGNVGYENSRGRQNEQSGQYGKTVVYEFNPRKLPYLPDENEWLAVDRDWQNLVKTRAEGGQTHYSVKISSRETMSVSEERMDAVNVDFNAFLVKGHVNVKTGKSHSFSREEETVWEISVDFKPLQDYNMNDNQLDALETKILEELDDVKNNAAPKPARERPFLMKIDNVYEVEGRGTIAAGCIERGTIHVGDTVCLSKGKTSVLATIGGVKMFNKILDEGEAGDDADLILKGVSKSTVKVGMTITIAEDVPPIDDDDEVIEAEKTSKFSDAEQEYLDNLKDFLEDDAEITPRERKMLDRIRQNLGISEERAKELEESLKPQLTEDEQEYLDMYREYAEKGEITEKERNRLNKFAAALGISEERIKQLEA